VSAGARQGEPGGPLAGLVGHLFRHAAGEMVAALARLMGPARLDLAEEAVQDALLRALETWPFSGLPDNPRGWLFQVARNRALDRIRHETMSRDALAAEGVVDLARRGDGDPARFGDESLAMMFMCCDPALGRAAHVALTLKLVSGFSVEEIADASLERAPAVAQRLVRAKREIRERRLALEIPLPRELAARLASVLEVIYLLFNEGYAAHGGESLVRADLCDEGIRLARLLAGNPQTDRPAVEALLALMLLQSSRLPARVDALGDLTLLAEQDRRRWDRRLMAEGLRHMERAAAGPEVTPYHLEAAIAACHATARDAASTDWRAILRLYDDLMALKPSPVVALNRAVAVAMAEGAAAGIAVLAAIGDDPALAQYHLLPAVRAGLERRAGRPADAIRHYRRALALRASAPERRFLERQVAELEGELSGTLRR
jgi:RNA polymerase sigma-70 factor (ECF subfamily)